MLTIELTQQELEKYWPGFQAVAYAVYDEKKVHLYNHPRFVTKPFYVMNWNDQFTGSTLILYEDTPTAIVDARYYQDYASLYSILVHELFHGYQFIQNEKRYGNEMLGVTYPLSAENLELRYRERVHLYHAVMASTESEKLLNLHQFVSLREARQKLMGEFLEYENLVETIEGPAWYVELTAFAEKSELSFSEVLLKYTGPLIDQQESALHLRRSCYSSGLALCLLLDELSADWKDEFLQSEKSLYEFFKERFAVEPESFNGIIISQKTRDLLDMVIDSREEEFSNFEKIDGYHVVLQGEMTFTGIDPMNIIQNGERCLHKNFLRVKVNGREILFQQPVLAYFKENIRDIVKIRLVLSKKPELRDCFLEMKGIGEINMDGLVLSIENL